MNRPPVECLSSGLTRGIVGHSEKGPSGLALRNPRLSDNARKTAISSINGVRRDYKFR
jgi:hypothetical protein